jgi:hypothetical protein
MSLYENPFRERAAEQYADAKRFVKMFAPGATAILPDTLWDRLIVLRSTPGSGKTSLMRLFEVDSVVWIRTLGKADPVYTALADHEVFNDTRVLKLGVRIDLDRDYTSLLDLPVEEDTVRRIFLRLLDVRILVAVVRGLLTLVEGKFPDEVSRIALIPRNGDPHTDAALQTVGGPGGAGLLEYARTTEQSIMRVLDSLTNTGSKVPLEGHSELYSIDIIGQSNFVVDGEIHDLYPVVMFDDGHRLHPSQRQLLLQELSKRHGRIARWYAERFEALSDQDLLSDVGREGRDQILVDIDQLARGGEGTRFRPGRYEKILGDIARRRAATALEVYAEEPQSFLELLDDEHDMPFDSDQMASAKAVIDRVRQLACGQERYGAWIGELDRASGLDDLIRTREIEILIERDRGRRQLELFDAPLSLDDLAVRLEPAIRSGAALAVSRELKLPYYGGEKMVLQLASSNAEQLLNICGELFAEMLVDVSLGRRPRLSLRRQDRVIRAASDAFWKRIPREIPNGRDVQRLVEVIAEMAAEENAKVTLPYPPGVTGTALLMSERRQLLDVSLRERSPGAERLFAALADAVAHNVLSVRLNYQVKNNYYMVMYLNRLLCPRFGLPLGYGGFREKRLSTMERWLEQAPRPAHPRVQPDQLPL